MKNLSEQFTKKRRRIQGAAWRRLDNTAKLFAAVSGEDLSSVFRISANLKEAVDPELLHRALILTLPEFENFRRQFGILYWGAYAKKPDGTDDANFYVLYNMHWEPHMFGLPHLPKGAKWHVICSTADPDVEDLPSDGTGEVLKNQMMLAVPPRGIMILESVADPDAGKETKKVHQKMEKSCKSK